MRLGVQGNGDSCARRLVRTAVRVIREQVDEFAASRSKRSAYDIFLTDRQTGAVSIVSTKHAGVQGDADSTQAFFHVGRSLCRLHQLGFKYGRCRRTTTASRMFPERFDDRRNRRVSWTARRPKQRRFGTGRVSLDGRYVVFQSFATNLLATSDTNGSADIFSAICRTGRRRGSAPRRRRGGNRDSQTL